MAAYEDFLARKAITDPMTGLTDIPELPDCLFPHQRDIVQWALRRGRSALFAGAKVTQTNRKGSISYSKAIKALKIEADFEPFRGKGSSFWGITE